LILLQGRSPRSRFHENISLHQHGGADNHDARCSNSPTHSKPTEPGTPAPGVYRRSGCERRTRERRHRNRQDLSTVATTREVRQDFGAFLFRERLLGKSRQQVRIRVISGLDRSQAGAHDIGQFVHGLQLRYP
jgi:hypothetical protein